MASEAQKVGLVPVMLMVAGNIMGSGVLLLPANLAATGGHLARSSVIKPG